MKKFMCALLAGCMALGFAGCGGNADNSAAGENTTEAAASAGSENSGKVYVIGTDTTFAPFEYTDESGKQVGIDMDILAAVAEDQGFEYQVNAMGFDAAVNALGAKQVDGVIAGMSITDERKEKFDFSDPYFDSGVVMAVPEDSEITGYADLEGKNVAVKQGTEGASFAESIKDEYGFTTTTFDTSDLMYQEVITGNSVACFDDYPVLGYAIKEGSLPFKLVTDKEQGSSYGFAVAKGENAELLEMFNKGFANIKANGTYDEILNNYISAE